MFSVDGSAATGGIPISASGSFDVDTVQSGLNLRKIQALRSLKAGESSLLKTSTSSRTLNTRNNPDVYGMLWPTLFPYGVGLFEDSIRLSPGFRSIHLRTHVKHIRKRVPSLEDY
ncbi:hypothetical protein BDZ89DRAFT_1152493 [Hymenopellis radicata]|nr:hypothetical protein BDZ89DRAFT_1152493 [Hymenopellis radicata]